MDYLQDMSIKHHDISGKLYIFYDKYHQEDNIQANNILSLFQRKCVFNTPFAGHTLGHILIGSDFFNSLTKAVIRDDYLHIKNLINKKLRIHPLKYQGLIRNALRLNHHSIMIRVLENLLEGHLIFHNPIFEREILALIKQIKDASRAVNLIKKFDFLSSLEIISNRELQGNFIYTAHDNFLCYNMIDQNLVLLDSDSVWKIWFVIPLVFHFQVGILGIFVNNNFMPLMTLSKSKFRLVNLDSHYQEPVYKMQPFLFYRKISDFYIISNGEFHATATPKATVDFGKTHIKDWEKFTIRSLSNCE